MIRFRVFGPPDLRGSDGREIQSVLAQPKRVALLAYLAAAVPRGFRSRDSLLGLFWAELDEDRARNALRQALHYLRRSLGEEVLVGRGDTDVGVAPEAFWCDALAFEDALARGDAEEALGLYRGDLLEGFFVADAPGFERWVERERSRLRGLAASAAWRLASEAERDGNLVGATGWARHAAALAPDDEAAFRRLLELLDRSGDRTGALRAFEMHAQRLALELEVEPARETLELVEEIRARDRPVVPRAPAGAEISAAPAPSAPPPAVPAPAPPTHSRGRRWLPTATAGVAGILILTGAVGSTLWRSDPPPEPGAASTVAVLPFSVHGSAEVAYLGPGIVDLISTSLHGAGEFRTIDPRALLSYAADRKGSSADPELGSRAAQRFGAGLYVLGSVVELDGNLRINAALYDADRPDEALVRADVEGRVGEVFSLVDRLTSQLVAGYRGGAGGQLARIAAVTTESLPALKAYLQGEAAYREGRYEEAIERLERAVAVDTAFALAHYRLAVTADWVNRSDLSTAAAERADRHGTRLPEQTRVLLSAFLAKRQGSFAHAEALYRSLLDGQPNQVEGWSELAELLFHFGPFYGRAAADSRPAFERAIALEPGRAEPLVHLARLAAGAGDTLTLDSAVRAVLELQPHGERTLEMRALWTFSRGDRRDQEQVLSALGNAGSAELSTAARTVAAFSGNLDGSLELARLLQERSRPQSWRSFGQLLEINVEMAGGRWAAGRAALESASGLEEPYRTGLRAHLYLHPFFPVSRGELIQTRARLQQTAGAVPPALPGGLPTEIARAHLLGIVAARLQDRTEALRQAELLEEFRSGAPDGARLGPAFGAAVRAHLAWADGRAGEALAALERIHPDVMATAGWRGAYTSAHDRYLRAELLHAAGRDAEALGWYASFPSPDASDLFYLAPSHLRRGEIQERMGNRPKAIEHYSAFVRLWREGDPEVRSLVGEVERRLIRLHAAQAAG